MSKKQRDPVFKPQGNIIISNRKFVMMFQKKRALSAALSLRSVRRRGACLRKIYSAAGFCRACFIITARKPGRGAGAFAAVQGCKWVRCFRCAGCGKSGEQKTARPVFFKPRGNIIISNRKFVMTFQKKRARRGAKTAGKKNGGQGVRRTWKAVRRRGVKVRRLWAVRWRLLRTLSAALSLRSVRRRGACLRKIYSAAGFCRACFIITARKPGRGAGAFAAVQGCKWVRCFRCAGCGKSGEQKTARPGF